MKFAEQSLAGRRPAATLCAAILWASTLCMFAVTAICPQSNAKAAPKSIRKNGGERWDDDKFYSPSLPPAKFLDQGQEVLFNSGKLKLSDLVYFVEDANGGPDLPSKEFVLKRWSKSEKKDVTAILDRVLHIAPGLLVNAASGSKLALCRASRMTTAFSSMSENIDDSAASVSCPCAIVVLDNSFRMHEQFHGLVHELVHEADFDGVISDSKPWVDFMNPIIARARQKLSMLAGDVPESVEAELLATNTCPSLYSCQDLKEALAEFMASYIESSAFKIPPAFVDQFSTLLLRPDQNMLAPELQFKHAVIASIRGEYKKSAEQLIALIGNQPKLAEAYTYLSFCFAELRDYKQAIFRATEALKCFDGADVPWTEKDRMATLRCLISCYLRTNQEDQAIRLLGDIVAHVPYDSRSLYQRFYIEFRKVDFINAAADLYWSRNGTDYSELFHDADTNLPAAAKWLDTIIAFYPQGSVHRLCRAHFLEWLGDREPDGIKKVSFYKRARNDYQKAAVLAALEHLDEPEIFLDCCNINLKLKAEADAKKYLAKGLYKTPKSLETKLMQIQILDAQGKKLEAERLFRQTSAKFAKQLQAGIPPPTSKTGTTSKSPDGR
jgi:tetratricopeptide (TPR) repeat protein